jgi:hypothetical protein
VAPVAVCLGWIAASFAGFDFESEHVSLLYFSKRDKVVRFLRGNRGEGLSVEHERLDPPGSVQLEEQALAPGIDWWQAESPGKTKTPGIVPVPAHGECDAAAPLVRTGGLKLPATPKPDSMVIHEGFLRWSGLLNGLTGKEVSCDSSGKLQESGRLWYTLDRSDPL